MRLLIDTHIALWATLATARLSTAARALIIDPENEILVSAVSIWEIAIKYARRRGQPDDMPLSGGHALSLFNQAGYVMLPILPAHAAAIDSLPPLHRDPFDRLLIAQASVDALRLLTSDKRLAPYGAMVLPA